MGLKPAKPNDPPKPLSEHVSQQMRRSKESGTGPELVVRKLLHASGLRYRVQYRTPIIPRRSIDIAFPHAKIAVFIDGCFWHGCSIHKTIPKNNYSWWNEKILSNRARDRDTDEKLSAAGWLVLRFWEHDPPASVAQKITDEIRQRPASKSKE